MCVQEDTKETNDCWRDAARSPAVAESRERQAACPSAWLTSHSYIVCEVSLSLSCWQQRQLIDTCRHAACSARYDDIPIAASTTHSYIHAIVTVSAPCRLGGVVEWANPVSWPSVIWGCRRLGSASNRCIHLQRVRTSTGQRSFAFRAVNLEQFAINSAGQQFVSANVQRATNFVGYVMYLSGRGTNITRRRWDVLWTWCRL